MTVPPQIRDMLDACRPDHDDLSAPEMASLAEALSLDPDLHALRDQCIELDRAIRDAITDVPVPDGLADRILARLAAQAATPPANTLDLNPNDVIPDSQVVAPSHVDKTSSGLPAVAPPAASPVSRRFRRRWLVTSFVAASLIIAVGIGWKFSPAARAPAAADELATHGILWSEQMQSAADWNSALGDAPLDRAVSAQVRGRPVGWRVFSTPYDSRAAAYALRGQTGEARLFVLCAKAAFLQHDDRPQRLPSTGGVAVAAWTEGPLLFVLVARERQQRLEDFFVPRNLALVPRPTHVLATQTPKTVDNGCAA